jgi:hypothetical protein
MNKYIVDKKISETIKLYAQSNIKNPIIMMEKTIIHHGEAGHCKNEKEKIVFLKHLVIRCVMIIVEIPQKTMHYKFMSAPGNAFHRNEGD